MGKNKRKGDSEPENSSLAAKKKLLKLKTISKPEKPAVTEIKKKIGEVLDSPKHANNIVDLIGVLELTEPGFCVTASINGLKRIFSSAIDKNQMKKPPGAESDPSQTSSEDSYKHWMYQRFEEFIKKLCGLLHHHKKPVTELALATVMSLLVSRHNKVNHAKQVTAWAEEDIGFLQSIVVALCSTKSSSKPQIVRFQEYLDYPDVKLNFLQIMKRLLNKAEKTKKATAVFLDNVLCCLEGVGGLDTPLDDTPTLLCHDPKNKNESTFVMDNELTKKNFGAVWIKFLKFKLSLELYKRVLVILHDKVLPYLPRPLLLTDFLLESYDVGGSISLLALSGVFTLVQQYNLEYPDFYNKLYKLVTPEVLHVKYKARFFHLADLFLASSHLPEYLVAAFAKRMARISLQGPSNSLVMCLEFIQNLILRHKGLVSLLHNPDRDDLNSDPFLPEEEDPAASRAMESSLWEVKTLSEHLLPQVSSVAKNLLKGVGEQEADVSKSLETTWQDMMDVELKRKVWINVPINFEKPQGILQSKDDVLSQIFTIE